MKKTICDACGEEKERNAYGGASWQTFEYLCHLDGSNRTKAGYVCFMRGQPVNISGRHESKDLCPVCYNKVMIASVLKFEEIRDENKKKDKLGMTKEDKEEVLEYALEQSDLFLRGETE